MFPSPCGVNIVAKKKQLIDSFLLLKLKFPSPCGVNIVAKNIVKLAKQELKKLFNKVSVPLRGKYRSEEFLYKTNI